jgi:hypothetical protein
MVIKYYVCTSYDEPTSTCETHVYIDVPPSSFFIMIVEDGVVVGKVFLFVFVSVYVIWLV